MTMKKRTKSYLKTCWAQGFSLVEVALALAVAAFCLLTLVALLPVGLRSYKNADDQGVMVNLATMVVRDLQATPSGAANSPRFKFLVPAAGGAPDANPQILYVDASGVATGLINAAPTGVSLYRICVAFYPPTGAGQKLATTVRIQITSPALADANTPNPPGWSVKYSNIFQTMVALNRN